MVLKEATLVLIFEGPYIHLCFSKSFLHIAESTKNFDIEIFLPVADARCVLYLALSSPI